MTAKGTDLNDHQQYLGDGVYASFDGLQVWLDLRGEDDTTAIGLDPLVIAELVEYAHRIGALK